MWHIRFFFCTYICKDTMERCRRRSGWSPVWSQPLDDKKTCTQYERKHVIHPMVWQDSMAIAIRYYRWIGFYCDYKICLSSFALFSRARPSYRRCCFKLQRLLRYLTLLQGHWIRKSEVDIVALLICNNWGKI